MTTPGGKKEQKSAYQGFASLTPGNRRRPYRAGFNAARWDRSWYKLSLAVNAQGEVVGNGRSSRGRGWTHLLCLALLVVYAFGLTRDLTQPWVGMHDWNGAFFSQLARNLLRYPWEIHHGMPVVAVGEQVPPPEERSIYATHPPGLVWLVAASFSLFGESEWAARLVPIVASAASFILLMSLVNRRYGREAALLAGIVYAAMPLSVFYGRMVDHEAVCLAGMLAALKCRQVCAIGRWARRVSSAGQCEPHSEPNELRRPRGADATSSCGDCLPHIECSACPAEAHGLLSVGLGGGGLSVGLGGDGGSALADPSAATQRPVRFALAAAIVFVIWIDWSGLLFAVLFCANAIIQWRGKRRGNAAVLRGVLVACAATVAATTAMLIYLVHAGLGGRWGDLLTIFTSRAGRVEECRLAGVWHNTLDNFTWPVLVLALAGLLVVIADYFRRRLRAVTLNQPNAPARVEAAERDARVRPRWRVGLVGRRRGRVYQPEAPARVGAGENQPSDGTARPAQACASAPPAPSALPVLAVTGLVWLAAFPRQYQIHGYWAFYLGPVAAALAATALQAIRERLARVNRVLGWVVLAVGCLAIIATGLNGAARFYRVRWFAEEVDSYRAIRRLTATRDRLVLFEEPIRPEQHGGYCFRNITPPHLAYYLDRAFDVDQDFARIAAHASRYAGLIIPLEQAAAHQTELRQFFGSFLVEPVGSKLYIRFSLSPQAASPPVR